MIKKMSVKIALSTLIMMLVISAIAPNTTADGWHPSEEFLHLYEPAQKAVISWNGTTEVMILSSAVRTENLTNIAWVVPILSTTKPNVTSGNMSIFEELVEFFGYSYWWYQPFRKNYGIDAGNGNITIIEISEVDIYDVIIIKATNSSDLIDWLLEHDLLIPDEAHDVIDRYVQMENCYFIINKLDLKNRFKDCIEQLENGTIPEDLEEYKKVLDDLQMGMATPLQFEFTPVTPYYPLVISSLNAGDGKIEVYVIAEKPVVDKNNVMHVDLCKNVSDDLKEKLQNFFSVENAQYVTRLSYNGPLNELLDDAVFEYFTESNPNDPVFIHIPPITDLLKDGNLIDILVYDQNGRIYELQYRLDKKGSWIIAERSDILYDYETNYWWYDLYDIPVYPISSGLCTIELEKEKLEEGNHTIDFRILRKNTYELAYTPVVSHNFTINSKDNDNTTINESIGLYNGPAILLSSLIVLSIVSVVLISRKITLPK